MSIVTKICSKCGNEKSIDEFRYKDKLNSRRSSHCNECQKLYLKNHYNNNLEYYKAKSKKYKKEISHFFDELKRTLFCSECGETHIACLDFHHVDPSDKEYNLSAMRNKGCSIELIKEELEKCIVLCSNCHRKLHYSIKLGGDGNG